MCCAQGGAEEPADTEPRHSGSARGHGELQEEDSVLKSKGKGWASGEAPAKKSRRLNEEQGTDSAGLAPWSRCPGAGRASCAREPTP